MDINKILRNAINKVHGLHLKNLEMIIEIVKKNNDQNVLLDFLNENKTIIQRWIKN